MRFACAAAIALAIGCDPYSYSTRIEVNDPSRVSLRAPGAAEPSLAAGAPPGTDVVVAQGSFATGPRTSTDYTMHARRDPGGGITLHIDTRLALAYGEKIHVLRADGVLDDLYEGYEEPPIAFEAPELTVPLCGDLARTRYSHYLTIGSGCSAAPEYRIDMTTPWSNVRSVTSRRRTAGPAVFVLVALLAGVSFAVPGAVLVAVVPETFAKVVGWTFIGIGAGATLPFVPFLVATDRDQIVYPR